MSRVLRGQTLRLLKAALARSCPDRVPRSGAAAKRVNCFSVFIDKNTEPYLLVRSVLGEDLECLEWSGERFDIPKTIPFSDVPEKELSVTHFYGYSEVQYSGFRDFVLGRVLRVPYVKIHVVRTINSVDQYFFNKRKLVTKQRIDLLRFLVAEHLDGRSIESHTVLMTGLYSAKWLMHPERDLQSTKLRFYLDSLVATGELEWRDGGYQMTGMALHTIETYEEQERKHTENVKSQRAMIFLTLAVVFLTAAQAGLIKFPTLLDLSK
jgi:hypothetical protein